MNERVCDSAFRAMPMGQDRLSAMGQGRHGQELFCRVYCQRPYGA